MTQSSDLQTRVNDILSGRGKHKGVPVPVPLETAALQRHFSPFVNEDLERAVTLASRLMQIAENKGGEAGIVSALEEIEQQSATEIPGLVQYAVKLFITHYPQARALIKVKPLEERQPNLIAPSKALKFAGKKPETTAEIEEAGSTPPEDKLDFWREDPLINEHHEHWHIVYPTSGRPTSSGGYELGDRHGELFAYMHEQMIARYDAERLAVGLSRVDRFSDYRATIPQGYNPGDLKLRQEDGTWYQFRARPTGATISDLTGDFAGRPGAKLSNQEAFRDRLFEAAKSGIFQQLPSQEPVKIDNLGNTEEANINSVDYYGSGNSSNNQIYGNHHNDGHIHLMLFDNVLPFGVMADTATAVRDPIFWRWHKHIDSIFHTWKEQQPPNNFSDAPPVKIRKSTTNGKGTSLDIILCRQDGLPTEFNGEQIASEAFGYSENPDQNNWNSDFANTTVKLSNGETVTTIDELLTQMEQRQIQLDDPSQTVTIDYLSHDDFYYFIRVENSSDQIQRLTVRIFLAPETELEDWASWIEMDKFLYRLDGLQRAVIFRRADLSSVIRKPALRPQDLADPSSSLRDQQPWCDCGWPYTMLLPRGTTEGMEFRLFVMFSSGDDLNLPEQPECCTSISYCGLQDTDYPDKRDMGYPFNRPFPNGISSAIAQYDNMASRTIKIRCKNL
ncbi:tyrosinase family protein [Nostoc sp. CCY 9925]|uniref:tyrosinase family protein n=1 Tax=Nostoc sp. CCY 9925 TaxID=3103865 RepID=UPI0039C73B4F